MLQFLKQSIATEKRCLLIITGKGGAGGGLIKREFRLWLEDKSVAPYILSVSEAHRQHGGSGAYYVLLRKNKVK